MRVQAALAGHGGHRPYLIDAPDLAAARVVRVFEAQQLRRGGNGGDRKTAGDAQRRAHIVGRKDAAHTRQQLRQNARQRGHAPSLVHVHMGALIEQHRIARFGVRPHGHLV